MKKNSDKEIKISFCPRCKSHKVKYIFKVGNLFGVMPKMKCEKCGFEMSSFPILVTSKKKLEASKNRKKKK